MMSDTSAIEWTDATWNPVTGCEKVSPGCDHCYAERITERFHGKGSFAIVQRDEGKLYLPLKWRKPRRIFVNSMSDLFHDDVPASFIGRVFSVMAQTPQHTYQILTKRHGRMRAMLSTDGLRQLVAEVTDVWPLPNVWLGVSVEGQQWADIRIPALVDTPAAVRWLSCEPLLGPLDLSRWLVDHGEPGRRWGIPVDWVVVGGESGPLARPMHPAWARRIRDQCTAAGVPFFFKQFGEWGPAPWRVEREPGEDVDDYKARAEATCATHAYAVWAHLYGHDPYRPGHKPWSLERTRLDETQQAPIRRWGKHAAGRELDGRTWDQYPLTDDVKAAT